jgi:hypothetical protein
MRGGMRKNAKKDAPPSSAPAAPASYIFLRIFPIFLGGGPHFIFILYLSYIFLYLYFCVLHIKCKRMRVCRELVTRLLLQGIQRGV